MRKLLCVVLVAMVSSLGWGQSSGGNVKTIKVGLSWHTRQSAIVQAWEDYFKKYSEEYGAKNGLNFQWNVVVADGDLARESSNIQDLINQKMDVIVAWAKDSAAIGSSIKAAHDAGIKFVTFDHQSSTEKPDAHVGADSYDQALTTAEAFVKILKSANVKGTVIELMGDLGDQNALARSKAWKETEQKYHQWKTVVQVPTEWKPEKFKSGLANALAAHPDANAIFLGSDFAFAAVQAALEEAGRWAPTGKPKHMWIATQDVMPQGYDAMIKGYIDVGTTYDAYNQAMELVKVVADLATGKSTGALHLVAGRLATPANIGKMENVWSRDYKD
jgi:ABC-type sugar transport system substrate-binding protein